MKPNTEKFTATGPAGDIECALDLPAGESRGLAVICHPHPLHGGTMDNKVVITLARALLELGYRSLRFNFRGIGASAGAWDEGRGEIDDALAVIASQRARGEALVLAGFSFGGHVASHAAARLADGQAAGGAAERLVLIAPAVVNFPAITVPGDCLVVHGEIDEVVPLAALFDWARPQSLPVTVLPGAGHFFHGKLTVLKQIVVSAWPTRTETGSR